LRTTAANRVVPAGYRPSLADCLACFEYQTHQWNDLTSRTNQLGEDLESLDRQSQQYADLYRQRQTNLACLNRLGLRLCHTEAILRLINTESNATFRNILAAWPRTEDAVIQPALRHHWRDPPPEQLQPSAANPP
jgi:hypothetical protein